MRPSSLIRVIGSTRRRFLPIHTDSMLARALRASALVAVLALAGAAVAFATPAGMLGDPGHPGVTCGAGPECGGQGTTGKTTTGDDTSQEIEGTPANDRIEAGGGDDTVVSGTGDDHVDLGSGDD